MAGSHRRRSLRKKVKRLFLQRSIIAKLMLGVFAVGFISSILFYLVESHAEKPIYSSYLSALKGIMILFFSGFDLENGTRTNAGFLFAIIVMLSGIIFVTLLIGDTSASIVESRLKHRRGLKKLKLKNHIILCNWNEHGSRIIGELLGDEIEDPSDICIVAELEEAPYQDPSVHFVSGNPSSSDVLTRAGIDHSHTAIILGGDGNEGSDGDAKAILTALAVEKRRPEIYSCVVISNPENKEHLKHAEADEVLCVGELIDKVLVQSTLNHGLSRLLSELLTFTEGSEIYKVCIPDHWLGLTFREAVVKGVLENGVMIIAIEVGDANGSGEHGLILDLGWERPLKEGDCAFVIAETMPEGFRRAYEVS